MTDKTPSFLPHAAMLASALKRADAITLAGAPEGFDAIALAGIARRLAGEGGDQRSVVLAFVARDGQRAARLVSGLGFVAPDIEVLNFPAWDCQPYDRVSPNAAISAERMTALARLARTRSGGERPRVLVTTVNALVQRVPSRRRVAGESLSVAPGNVVAMDAISGWLEVNGYLRSSTVRDVGEYAVRGGILDLWAPSSVEPVRLDFFGDTLETIRPFDPETQRSTGQLRALDLVAMSEVQLTTESIRRFRSGYVATFGAAPREDTLYEAISEGRRHPGLEHWLPLFHAELDALPAYLDGAPLVLDHLAEQAIDERLVTISDYHEARRAALEQAGSGAPYRPLPPERLYLTTDELKFAIEAHGVARLTPFAMDHDPARGVIDIGARKGRDFSYERAETTGSVFDAAVAHLRELRASGRTVVLAAWSEGSRERLATVVLDHEFTNGRPVASLLATGALAPGEVGLGIWGLEAGFITDNLAVVSEQDILGDRLIRPKRKGRRPQDVIAELSTLGAGDLVVHVDHGIGRFIGLRTIEAAGAPHDCLELHYAGGDKLFLPVENIELLSRYGSEDTEAQLDRLGGAGWQQRKAKLKQRIREMAGKLIEIAAARALREAPRTLPAEGIYDEFRTRFPYEETEDQETAIQAVLDDLASGRPMDRLVCGDVGFGKTEVALRAAFVVAMSGRQVAVVVPTTLLARQHFKTFSERFKGLPVRVAQASRFVGSAELKAVKEGIADGTVDIVIGTHALLGKTVKFKDLGLVIVDEEQHFGVGHKERLKELRAEVHVLTLSATPIPRTLQLALTGVRDLSIIATPPVDRLAVRTFVMPFDPLIVREALLRERYRGGQTFYVVPRIEDLAEVREFLAREVPEAKVAVAHGQMAAGQLEDVMSAFYDGQYDILLSTTIVESGLDIPTANTLIVHRADMFGLAQLYQLRGRVGRSKTRAYALFTVPVNRKITPTAEKRLQVLQSLDTLGAGFQLASHDLDIRGAGNLLGEEQSGHIREVGYELYQQMLEEAVANLRAGVVEEKDDAWSPTIAIGIPVVIPETYIEDLALRLNLYRKLSTLTDDAEIESMAAEFVDRFGPLPDEVEQLLSVVRIKALCRRANIDKVEAGAKGVVVAFRDNSFANPAGLVAYVAEQGSAAKVRPDMRIVFIRDMETPKERLKGVTAILRNIVRVADRVKDAPKTGEKKPQAAR